MAITAYCGYQGSGKTYEVVATVILGALRTGRRVVANIRGLHYEEMRAYLMDEENIDAAKIGELVTVALREPEENEHFFFQPQDPESVTRPGDLVVLDECWSILGTSTNIPRRAMDFFRMHRQYTDASGLSCDIVLITQSMQDLNRKVKVVVEKHYYMEKLKRLGLTKQYTVDAFNGYKTSNNHAIRRLIRKYNPKFYPFYSSYAGKGGDEREVDGRINVLKSPLVMLGIPLGLLMMFAGIYGLYYLWFAKGHSAPQTKEVEAAKAKEADAVKATQQAKSPAISIEEPPKGEWRSVGFYSKGDRIVAVLESAGGARYYVNPESYRVSGTDFQVYVDGKLATAYTGSAVGAKPPVLGR